LQARAARTSQREIEHPARHDEHQPQYTDLPGDRPAPGTIVNWGKQRQEHHQPLRIQAADTIPRATTPQPEPDGAAHHGRRGRSGRPSARPATADSGHRQRQAGQHRCDPATGASPQPRRHASRTRSDVDGVTSGLVVINVVVAGGQFGVSSVQMPGWSARRPGRSCRLRCWWRVRLDDCAGSPTGMASRHRGWDSLLSASNTTSTRAVTNVQRRQFLVAAAGLPSPRCAAAPRRRAGGPAAAPGPVSRPP